MRARLVAPVLAVAAAAATVWLMVPAVTSIGAREDLPPPYVGRTNPFALDAAAVARGAALFSDNCASCHGTEADGHGPAAHGLVPPPADFRGTNVLGTHSDAYLYYRMSEGKPGTAMPSFHGALDESERWAVVSYLRSLGRGGAGH